MLGGLARWIGFLTMAIGAVFPLVRTEQEAKLVTSWAAPPTWVRGHTHPGRGKYLIKSGERMGLPVSMTLTPTERFLYDTDGAWQTPAVAAQLAAVAAHAGQIAQAAAARELP